MNENLWIRDLRRIVERTCVFTEALQNVNWRVLFEGSAESATARFLAIGKPAHWAGTRGWTILFAIPPTRKTRTAEQRVRAIPSTRSASYKVRHEGAPIYAGGYAASSYAPRCTHTRRPDYRQREPEESTGLIAPSIQRFYSFAR